MRVWNFLKALWFDSTPRHAIADHKKPKKRRYDGAKRGRHYGKWFASQNSANADIWQDLNALRSRSRDLCRNNDYARGVINKLVDNVVYQGIFFQSQVRKIKDPKHNDDRINSMFEAAFKEWAAEKKWCHTAGKLNFVEIQQLAFKCVLESGEVFIRKVKKSFSDSPVPFALEVIEADQCCDDYYQPHNNNNIVMGVEVDKWQRPIAYWFHTKHPGDVYSSSIESQGRKLERVPADEIIHLHFSDRPNQYRGLPILYSTLLRLKNIGDYEESEQLAAKLASCVMGIVSTPDSDLLGSPDDCKDEALPADEQFCPGVIRYIAPGESFDTFDPSRPNPNLIGFIEQQLRASGAGIGASYETISNDYSKSNYSSSRLSLTTSRDRFKVLQNWFVNNFCQKVLFGDPGSDGWLDMAILSGRLNFADYELRPQRYHHVRWQTRGWTWIDPHKEIQGTIASLAAGMTSLTKVYSEQGEDFEETVKTIARERALLEENGIIVNFNQDKSNNNNFEETTNAGAN